MSRTESTSIDSEFELDPQLRCVAPVIKAGLAFWEERRQGRLAPTRTDFSLRDTKAIARNLQIIELIGSGPGYRQRLTGTSIVEQLKEDPTGNSYEWPNDDPVTKRMQRAVAWVIANKKPLRTFAHRTALPGQDFFSHETLFLPLSNEGKRIDMLALVSSFQPVSGV
jgi:hypothetical protein